MQDVLEKLGLASVSDERTIKAAYAKKLKLIDIANDPSEFQSLREAYELALSYVSNERSATLRPADVPSFGANYAEQPEEKHTEIFGEKDSFSLILSDLHQIAYDDDFDFLRWLDSYKYFDSLEARARLSEQLLHEFVTNENDWPLWLMHHISQVFNWHEIRIDGLHNTIVSQFYEIISNANYVQNIRPNVKRFFEHPWKNRTEANEALLDFIAKVEPTYHPSLSYDVYQAGCAASSAWAALLAAKEVFGWHNLDYATNQVLELSLREARFREKLHEITGQEIRAPYDAQKNAIWRLRKPYDYLDGHHPIDPITHVLNLADAYGINKDEVFNPEQLKFYLAHINGAASGDEKINRFFGKFFTIIFIGIIVWVLAILLI